MIQCDRIRWFSFQSSMFSLSDPVRSFPLAGHPEDHNARAVLIGGDDNCLYPESIIDAAYDMRF